MGKLHACFIVAVGALAAACGDDGGAATADAAVDSAPDAKIFMDAPPPMFDLTCIGNSAPATADANITLSGFAQELEVNPLTFAFTQDPIVDADVKACDTAACNGPADGSTTTDNMGDWSIGPIATGGAPLADYLELTKTNVRTNLVFPHAPFVADQPMIPFLSFGTTLSGLIGQLYSDCADLNDPLLFVAVTDCANAPITDTANLAITIRQGGTPVAGAMVHDLSQLPMAPAQVAGLFLVCGVPANDATEVGATYNGMTLLAHTVKTIADGTTSTQVRPGY